MKCIWSIKSTGLVLLSAFSFWSSGVFLVRALRMYGFWDGGTRFALLCLLSIPLVYLSIVGVKKISTVIHGNYDALVHCILALVMLMHATGLSVRPALYGLDASPALMAAAWLLWFGGISVLLVKLVNKE